MKKNLIIVFFALLEVVLIAADGISRSPEGLIQAEKQTFGICFWEQNWKSSASQLSTPDIVSYLGEAIQTPQGMQRNGVYRISEDLEFQICETTRSNTRNDLDLKLELTSASGVPSAVISFQTMMPNPEYMANPVIFNGNTIVIKNQKQIECPSRKQDELLIPLKNGILKITGAFSLTVRQNQGWEFTEVRILFSKTWGKIHQTDLKLHMAYIPYTAEKIDMKSVVNMGFRDEFASDQKGGWTDQGPQNDLSMMPTGSLELGGIPFDVINPAANQNKSCLAFKGEKRPYFLEQATVSGANAAGKYLYVLNGVAWAPNQGDLCGAVRIKYQDGTIKQHELKCAIDTGNFWNPLPIKNATVCWQNSNAEANIGLYATRILLNPEKKVSEITLLSRNQVWMVLAATISNREPSAQKSEILTIVPGENLIPLPFSHQTEPGSVIDLSQNIKSQAPAGKYGFVKSVGGHFEFENRPGVPVRFWGVNTTGDAHYMEHDITSAMMDELSAMGCNSIRIHHFDSDLNRYPDADGGFYKKNLDRLDYFVAEAKKRGIYITLDFFTYRHRDNMERLGNPSQMDYKVLCYFNEKARAGFMDFAKQLMGHVNPYTGVAWKDEPAITSINLINEGTLNIQVPRVAPAVKALVEKKFQEYVTKHNIKLSDENRGRYWTEFLTDAGKTFFLTVRKELQDFGVKAVMCDQNFGDPALDTRNTYDYVDTHFYFSHPISFSGSHLPPTFYGNGSPIKGFAAGVRDVALSRILGKPFALTEWNYCWPNRHFFEGPFLTGAYAALQDYSGLWSFDVPNYWEQGQLGPFTILSNTMTKLSMRAGSLFYLRGDVKASENTIATTVEASKKMGMYPQLLSKYGIVYPPYSSDQVIAALPGENISPAKAVTGKDMPEILQNMAKINNIPAHLLSLEKKTAQSDTGEILLDAGKEMFTVSTPRSEALLLPAKGSAKGKFMRVKNGETHAAFYAASTDNALLAQGNRIMLLHLTNISNEGTVFRNADMSVLEAYGNSKQLLCRNKAEIELYLDHAAQYKLFACSPNGKRLFEVPLHQEGNQLSFTADNESSHGGIVLYELIRQHAGISGEE